MEVGRPHNHSAVLSMAATHDAPPPSAVPLAFCDSAARPRCHAELSVTGAESVLVKAVGSAEQLLVVFWSVGGTNAPTRLLKKGQSTTLRVGDIVVLEGRRCEKGGRAGEAGFGFEGTFAYRLLRWSA